MAFSFAKLFGSKKPELSSSRPESLTNVPGGEELLTMLRKRSAGEGLGFSPEAISRETGAFAAQRRAGLTEQEIPRITGMASARGLGRSSLVPAQVGRATQAAERDIESRVAQLALENERQKRAEQQAAIQGLQRFTEAEADQTARKAQLEAGLSQAQNAAQRQAALDTLGGIMGLGELGLGATSTIGKLAGIGGYAPTSYDLSGLVERYMVKEPEIIEKSGETVVAPTPKPVNMGNLSAEEIAALQQLIRGE